MLAQLPIVVGVAGRIGSGKTAVSQCLAREFGFQYLRYSQVLAEWFEASPDDKAHLQEVGEEVMTGGQQQELNRRMIGRIAQENDAVIDGLRHPLDYESLSAEFGSRFSLIFVEAPEAVRFERVRDRFSTYGQFQQADSRPVESHIDSLRALAKQALPGTMPPQQMQGLLREFIQGFRQRAVA